MAEAYYGVNYNNLRKALYLLYFGIDFKKDANGNYVLDKDGKRIALSEDFSSPKYKYIIPMQGNFENPLNADEAKDTYMLYWIERDTSLTQDDYVQEGTDAWNRQKCVASILLRFVGAQAESWSRVFRHLAKRSNVTPIWSGVCNAEKLEYTAPIVPNRVNFFGKNNVIAFDVRFKLYYDEDMTIDWGVLEGITMKIVGTVLP